MDVLTNNKTCPEESIYQIGTVDESVSGEVCPLAFGEVGVKERVKSVLNYKKPTLWIMIAAAAVLVILAICFLTNPTREYQIRITIPAGSTESFCYSDEEISPKRNTLTFYASEGLGDTEIVLLPIEVREENAYDKPSYITPGMPVKMDADEMPLENEAIQNVMLYAQPQADKVCIKVQPSMIREYAYYYIPTDKDQEWLSAQVEALDLEGKPLDGR